MQLTTTEWFKAIAYLKYQAMEKKKKHPLAETL